MLDVLLGFLGPRAVFLVIDSFSVVEVSNDLLPEVGPVAVELKGGVNMFLRLTEVLFHDVLGRALLVSSLQLVGRVLFHLELFSDLLLFLHSLFCGCGVGYVLRGVLLGEVFIASGLF